MRVNEEKKNLYPMNWKDCYVVADFDRTITNGVSKTSWSILAESDLVPPEYTKERQELYDIYRPMEIDPDMPLEEKSQKMKEWFALHINLFVKYGIKEELFEKAATDLRIMEFRRGAREFLRFLYENDVPMIIISAGIGNFIECFLKNNGCLYDNIYISSNKIKFTDGVASGVEDNIIHSLNKNEVSLPENIREKCEGRNNVVLLGDQVSDLNMVDESKHEGVIKVGFMTDETHGQLEEYERHFDIVIENGEDYNDLLDVLN